jgi:hypothetical protein
MRHFKNVSDDTRTKRSAGSGRDLREMLERELTAQQIEEEEFSEMLSEEKNRLQQEEDERQDERRLHGRPGRYMVPLRRFGMSETERNQESRSQEQGTGTDWAVLRPLDEEGTADENASQIIHEHERPSFLVPGNFEMLLDTMSDQIGRWADREEVLHQMERKGQPGCDAILAMEWMIQQGKAKSIDDGRKISKPEPGVRINGRRKCESRTLLLTYFPEWEYDGENLRAWTDIHCEYAIAGIERCPKTNKEHVHVLCEFTSEREYKWLKYVFPTVNIRNDLKNRNKAIEYVTKNGPPAWEINKAGSWRLGQKPVKKSKREIAGEVLQLAREGKVDEIARLYPDEYLHHHGVITKEAASAQLARLRERPKRQVNLREKNMFIWGDAGTGKSWLADNICGPRPYMKTQNKW